MEETLSSIRHAARGHFNSIKLCVSALDLECTREEEMEFLDDVIRSSEKLCELIDKLETVLDCDSHAESGHSR